MGNVIRKVLVLNIFLFASLLISPNGLATFNCSVAVACSDVNVFEISSVINAHAQLPGQSGAYPLKVCCGGVPALNNSCTGNNVEVVGLSGQTNAHVEKNTLTNYPYSACLSGPSDYVLACDYASSCSSLGKSYACLAAISGETSAHVERCDFGFYPLKICCKVKPSYDFDLRISDKVSAIVGEQFELEIEINNIGALSDSYNVTFASAFPNLVDISNPSATTDNIESDQAAQVSALVRPLTDDDNTITVTVTSKNVPSLQKSIVVSLRTKKYSLPEFGLSGFLQIIIISAFAYAIFANRPKKLW